MAVVNGTNLQNVSDVIDAIRSELVSNHNWTTLINSGTVGSNDKEVWITLDPALTKNGDRMTIGMAVKDSDTMYLTATVAALSETTLQASPKNPFITVVGQPNIQSEVSAENGDVYEGVTLGVSDVQNGSPVEINLFNQGANYLNHFILTPDQVSPQGTKEQYCYCCVEVSSGVWRTIAFGEGIKLAGGSWDGGVFVDGSWHYTADGANEESQEHRYTFGADTRRINGSSLGYVYVRNNYSREGSSPQLWNPWAYLGEYQAVDDKIAPTAGFGPRLFGRGLINHSPSTFSGLTQRIPARVYLVGNEPTGISDVNVRPLIEFPDVFISNIRDFTPGTAIQDDSEKFLVVPFTAKSGANNSGNYGLLIRNPDLTV